MVTSISLKAANLYDPYLYRLAKLTTPFLSVDHHSATNLQPSKNSQIGLGLSVKLINIKELTQYIAPLLRYNTLTAAFENMTLVPIPTVTVSTLLSPNISLQSELLRYAYSKSAKTSKYTLGINWSYLNYLMPTRSVNASLTAYYSDVDMSIHHLKTSLSGFGFSHTLEKRLMTLSFFWSYGIIYNHIQFDYSHYNHVSLTSTSMSMQNTLGVYCTINRVRLALEWVYIPTSSLFGASITFVI